MGVYTAKDFPELSRLQADRTAAQINSMHPTVGKRFYNSVTQFNTDPENVAQGRVISVTEGFRSNSRSDEIRASGTYAASGGNSWHNYSAAGDVIILENGVWDENNSSGAYTGKATEIFEQNGLTNPHKNNDSGHFQPVEVSNGVPASVKNGSTTISDLLGEPNEPTVGDTLPDGNVDTGESADSNTGNWSVPPTTVPYTDLTSARQNQELATNASTGNQEAMDELVIGYKQSLEKHVENNPHLTVEDLDTSEYTDRAFALLDSEDPVDQAKGSAMLEALNEVSADMQGDVPLGQSTGDAETFDLNDPRTATIVDATPNVLKNTVGRPTPNWYTSVDLPTYRFTFYLVSPEVWNDPESYLENDSAAIRTDKAQVITKTGTETYYSIDNMLFQSKVFPDTTKGSVATTTFQFEIKEPMGFTLLEKILTKSESYTFNTMRDAKYVLKLELQGRNSSTGTQEKYPGTHYYPLVALNISAETGEGGTSYIFTCGSIPAIGSQESVIKAGNITVKNITTLKTYVENLTSAINKSELDAITPPVQEYTVHSDAVQQPMEPRKTWNIYVGDSGKIGGFGDSSNPENEKYVPNFDLENMLISSANSAGEAADMNNKDSLTETVSNETNLISYLRSFITKQPAWNEYYKDLKEKQGVDAIIEIKSTPVFENRIHEESNQQFVKQNIEIGIVLKEVGIDYADSQGKKFTPTYQGTRFDNLPIVKKYEYIYTGKNTEVLNLTRNFNLLFAQAKDPKLGSNTANSTQEAPGTNLVNNTFLSDNSVNGPPDDVLVMLPKDTQVSSQYDQQNLENTNNSQDLLATYALQYDTRITDMNIVEIDIIGDPYWLGIPGSVFASSSSTLTTLNTGGQQFVVLKNYYPDSDTLKKGEMDLYSTGVYEVREVEHRFQQGQYISKLTMYRDINSNSFILQKKLKDL